MNHEIEFGEYELLQYVQAVNMLPKLKANRESFRESLYDECLPKTSYLDELGVTRFTQSNPADIAIRIMSIKENYDKTIERYEKKAEIFQQAFSKLTPEEQRAIGFRYLKGKNNVYSEALEGARMKLYKWIYTIQAISQKESKFEKVQAWKESRTASA